VLQEFVDEFRGFRLNDMVCVSDKCLPPYCSGSVPASGEILEWINRYGNRFEIKTIQQIDADNAMFSFYNVKSTLDYYQIELYVESKRVVNF
jgi:hypothetical protein